jgi:uncharacterized protein RhaS with RHS repeats
MLIRDTRNPTWTHEYLYGADDERIAMIAGSTWHWTLRDFSGLVLREMTSTAATNGAHSNWQWTRDNVWRGAGLLSSVQPSASTTSTYHYHLDHLGTPCVVSNTSGTIVRVHEYAAFGAEYSGNAKEIPESRFKFTDTSATCRLVSWSRSTTCTRATTTRCGRASSPRTPCWAIS